MTYVTLPRIRTVIESMPLHAVKLEKLLTEGQSRVASYLDIHYPDGQDVIFLLGGKPVKAGRLSLQGREILTVNEALDKLRAGRQGTISFYEISKLLMVVIMGTFIFEPTHGRLKAKLINVHSFLALLERKRFTGYLELKLNGTLNYLTFFKGAPRDGYFTSPMDEPIEAVVAKLPDLIEAAEDSSELNVYESIGEEGLHEDAGSLAPAALAAPTDDLEGRAEFTAEILDLCLAAIYEDLFRLMSSVCLSEMNVGQVEVLFREGLDQVSKKFPQLFGGALQREDGTPLPGGMINFERLLKAKNSLPVSVRDVEFMNAMNELSSLRLHALRRALSPLAFTQALKDLSDKVATSRKAYLGNFTIIKFLYEFARLLEKARVA